ESGAARHNLRKQIPQHDLIVTNYALLRRDLEALQKFAFRAVILDEAQFIKNPGAQVTQSVKQLKSEHRLALTGTPLENRLLDLWSITDFVQPGYLGNQEQFTETYEPRGENAESAQRIARRRLSAKLRPLLLRRMKKNVAKDLPERIEQRRDCELGDEQRKLYLAELRRSRQQVVNTFQNNPNASVFLLSLRAAGTGLNLTTASYVILYDPWWNPAVEAQAIDRSHRIGQTQTVNAYRLISPGTVEEKIWELQQSKAQTIADVLGEEGFARSLSKTDLEYLFSED